MNEIEIKKHNFELAKNRLKTFSEKTEAELAIEKVKNDGGFLGLGDHKVTGYEFNNRIETIQNHLVDINTTNNKIIREFREVYNALDALDKDYMLKIVASVAAINKTSEDVRIQQGVLSQHHSKLQEQQNKLDSHQVDIDNIIDNINKTVNVLKSFKEKLDRFKHLSDIDKIWLDCKTIRNEINLMSDKVSRHIKDSSEGLQENAQKIDIIQSKLTATEQKIKEVSEQSDVLIYKMETIQNDFFKHQDDISRLLSYMKKLQELKHLMDIDSFFEQMSVDKVRIKELEKKEEIYGSKFDELIQTDSQILEHIDLIEGSINHLDEYNVKLSTFSHLEDVDSIWENVESHTSLLSEIVASVKENKEEMNERIADAVQETNRTVQSLAKKVKFAYLIAGGTAGLAIAELLLLLI